MALPIANTTAAPASLHYSPQAAAYRAYADAHPGTITPAQARTKLREQALVMQRVRDQINCVDGLGFCSTYLTKALQNLVHAIDALDLAEPYPES
mgnify:CR=1 FL=1